MTDFANLHTSGVQALPNVEEVDKLGKSRIHRTTSAVRGELDRKATGENASEDTLFELFEGYVNVVYSTNACVLSSV